MGRINYDLIGQKFGKLLVIDKIGSCTLSNGRKKIKWLCKCECGNDVELISSVLVSGKTKSCGCLKLEKLIERNKAGKKYNVYDLTGEYGIGYTNKNIPFYFDKEDYEIIKDYCWHIIKGYPVASIDKHTVSMHRIITNVPNDKVVDHINHNTCDNRKENLRICTNAENVTNVKLNRRNTTGAKGVYERPSGRYTAYISKNNKKYWLGTYDTIKEASDVYDKKALEFFGEFAYLNNYQENT